MRGEKLCVSGQGCVRLWDPSTFRVSYVSCGADNYHVGSQGLPATASIISSSPSGAERGTRIGSAPGKTGAGVDLRPCIRFNCMRRRMLTAQHRQAWQALGW